MIPPEQNGEFVARMEDVLEIKKFLNKDYPQAKCVVLICDNLNTHSLGALYETFPPDEARCLARRLDIHYTPKHGSWLDV